MDYKKIKSGFTLIEMIIAIGLTGMLSGLSAYVLINIMRTQKVVSMQEAIMEDSQVIIGLLKTEIQFNAIDYEEYYNNEKFGYDFGKKYGEYGKEFYDSSGNPTGTIMDTAIKCSADKCGEGHLALISPNGMEKTVYALKKTDSQNDEKVLSVMHLYGCDSDLNGIAEKFLDAPDNCGTEPASYYGLDELLTGINLFGGLFAPISSTRTNIIDLKFYIAPVNDPHKAYAMPEYVYQPKVTIILTIKPSARYFGTAAKKVNPIIIRTTATPRLLGEVKSYK